MPTIMRDSLGRWILRNGAIGTTQNCCCSEPYVPPGLVGCYDLDCGCCLDNKTPSLMSVDIQGLYASTGSNNCAQCPDFNQPSWVLSKVSFCGWSRNLTPNYECRRELDPTNPFKFWNMGLNVSLVSVEDRKSVV